jgi:pSer/pThr/pTyr-binding forkhead associated (FHA) protein
MPQEGETTSWLETTHGDRILLHGICSIGRAESNNIIISKGAVSRHHAIVHERDKAYWVVDLGGVNGLLLNGERVVQTAKLKSGDIIGIPTTDFIFLQEPATAKEPASAETKATPPPEITPVKEPAPVEPKAIPPAQDSAPSAAKSNFPLEGPMEAKPKPELSSPIAEVTTPAAVTIPLPHPRKPTQQDELALGLPPETISETSKLRKPRVYVGPIDTQGMPKSTTSQPLRPEAFKLTEAGAAKPFSPASLPKSSGDELLKITTPLSPVPWVEKPKEIKQVNASDVIVWVGEKPQTPPVLPKASETKIEPDSFLQPSISQEATASTKSVTLLQKPKEAIPLSSVAATVPDASKTSQPLKTSQSLRKAPPPLPALNLSDKSDGEGFILAPAGPKELPSLEKAPPLIAKIDKSEGADEKGFILVPPVAKEPTPALAAPPLLLMDKPAAAKQPAPLGKTPAPLAPAIASVKPAQEDLILIPSEAKELHPKPAISLSSPAKPDTVKPPSTSQKFPDLHASSKLQEPKKPIQKTATPSAKVQAPATPKIVPQTASTANEFPAPQGALCPTALHSMYIGLASIFLPFLGLISAPVAIFLGHSALKEIHQSRGVLTGRQSAILGLYFGYISLVLISSYSILIYVLFFSSTPSKITTHSLSTPAPIVLAQPNFVSPAPPADITKTSPPPAAPAPSADIVSPPPEITKSPQPQPTPDTGPQTVITDSTGGNASAMLQNNSSPPANTNTAPATPSAPATDSVPAPSGTPAVYDPNILNRLKDGMLQQPMPEDATSAAYQDAEAFNNCARLLARPPDAKYAESVGDFLEDVKKRNPDPARLQILSAMYDNYMAGIKRDF